MDTIKIAHAKEIMDVYQAPDHWMDERHPLYAERLLFALENVPYLSAYRDWERAFELWRHFRERLQRHYASSRALSPGHRLIIEITGGDKDTVRYPNALVTYASWDGFEICTQPMEPFVSETDAKILDMSGGYFMTVEREALLSRVQPVENGVLSQGFKRWGPRGPCRDGSIRTVIDVPGWYLPLERPDDLGFY